MTMPHLMNCPHDDNGWCLACVRKLWEKAEAMFEYARCLPTCEGPKGALGENDCTCGFAEVRQKIRGAKI